MDEKIGAVLVIGGGIGGMQSALDLANSGFKVFLVERSPAIGGRMAQLDKTFPTNDCSMCILSPKLVEVARHPNIELLTLSEISCVEGKEGNFKVTVLRHPRYVDESRCIGCGECAKNCPVEIISEFDMELANKNAIYVPFPQAVPLKYTIQKRGKSPCKVACPTKTNVQGYVALIRERKFREALELVKKAHPFPGICGRICTHPCELNCKRGEVDDPLAISALKRFLADLEPTFEDEPILPKKKEKKPQKVAVIGGGPAGLTAAYNLTVEGYQTTVFEALPVLGGMMRVGIPSYRLPREVLRREIDNIISLGVEVKLDTPIGEKIKLQGLQKDYDAIFIAAGAHNPFKLGIEGEDLKGVYHGVTFMRKINLGEPVELKDRVAVIGGGNTAMDCARSARRMGINEVFLLYRRSRNEMPVDPKEVEEAGEEGVKFHFLCSPTRILSDNGETVSKIECIKMKLGEPDKSGRRRPIPIEGSEFVVDVDMVISAVSQAPDISFLPEEAQFEITKWERLAVNPTTLMTNTPGVFAGGDFITGPSTVIDAIAAGERAAITIDKFLQGAENLEESLKSEDLPDISSQVDIEDVQIEKRRKARTITLEERLSSFEEVELGLTEEEAIAEANRCLSCGICSECLECVKSCEAEAVDHEMVPTELELNVGSIVVSTGFDLYEPDIDNEYGYRRFPNVITNLQFERILSASGPYQGKVRRLSDEKEPRKIAFLQCVGSRDERSNEYCSSVCCMAAMKEALLAQEHVEGLETHIFFMDIRAFGKEFDDYYIRAKEKYGIKFTRCRIPNIEEDAHTNNLILSYLENEEMKQEVFEMVVLSTGLIPPRSNDAISDILGIDLNESGFCSTKYFSPMTSSRPGIYVCGAFSSPKNIPETVIEASGAAAKASSIISSERNSLVSVKEYPPEKDITAEKPRIGVFVCNCGINIGSVVDVPAVVEYAKTLPNVVKAEEFIYTCSQDTQKKMMDIIEENDLNRVVVSACTPRTHEPLFQNTIQEAGLNPYLFEMANIREQCSWVHNTEPEEATRKAMDLVRVAVSKSLLNHPLMKRKIDIVPRGLVIGGGITGMTAALELSAQGYETFLIERENELGGAALNTHYMLGGEDPQEFLRNIISRVHENELIHVSTGVKIKNIDGVIGNFKTTIIQNDAAENEFDHGIIILAIGGKEYIPSEYLYGVNKNVCTRKELEEKLVKNTFNSENVVMIQCVGSRTEERTYCSRVCCSGAIKNALKIKEQSPDTNIYVLYKDIRTYGFREKYYREAAEKGIIFIRYDDENLPIVSDDEGLQVSIREPILNREITLIPDLLVLSNAILPQDGAIELSQMLKLPMTKDGFFLEAHVKLRPVDFATPGVFLAGLAHSPKFIDESIAQASAAAARAGTILSKESLEIGGTISVVDPDKCATCLTCIRVCPYSAPKISKEGVARIDEAECQGCGICVSECPAKAIQLQHFRDDQLLGQCNAILKEVGE